jgi:hypothetical protein
MNDTQKITDSTYINRPQQNDVNFSVANSPDDAKASPISGMSRRAFLGKVGGAILVATSGAASLDKFNSANAQEIADSGAAELSGFNGEQRRTEAFNVRKEAAQAYLQDFLPPQLINGDETLYADYRASFFKTLPQNDFGEVERNAYEKYLEALRSADPADFEAIPLSPYAERSLANPQAAYVFEMTGLDSHATRMPPAPKFASSLQAAEMGEVYWQALTRDVPYRQYGSDSLIQDALADLNVFSQIVGPKQNGQVTVDTLFRGETPGDLIGPFISQFLWLPVPYGISRIEQKYHFPVSGDDFGIDYNEWLEIQRGAAPALPNTFGNRARYINNNRALGEYVHQDITFQAYFNAALIIFQTFGSEALASENPYLTSSNQGGFVTFGLAQITDLLTKAANISLTGAWFQKWLVHRRLRPEVFGGRIEIQLNRGKNYGIHPEIIDSDAVTRLLSDNGNALLPLAFPEGSPTHPSYPAGHATVAGACSTILKAFFDEDYVIPNPVEATANGFRLDPWTGATLTLGNEINKLANNISLGRDAAGVHYRSDGIEGLKVGEQQAIGLLRDYSRTYNEEFDGFSLMRFDGVRIRIVNGEILDDNLQLFKKSGSTNRWRFNERQ